MVSFSPRCWLPLLLSCVHAAMPSRSQQRRHQRSDLPRNLTSGDRIPAGIRSILECLSPLTRLPASAWRSSNSGRLSAASSPSPSPPHPQFCLQMPRSSTTVRSLGSIFHETRISESRVRRQRLCRYRNATAQLMGEMSRRNQGKSRVAEDGGYASRSSPGAE
jgi:hypothetical protein